ncbi:hypothetical protein [Allomuricauda sp. d1]|uniref:hypothetical protein n=1 Tax=Allomuricauda sp. d1 TaxID=3136725 RepID=UPI0031D8DAFB
MPSFVKKEFDSNTKTTTFYYSQTDQDTFEADVDNFFVSEAYRLVEGDKGNGVYEKGDRTLRLLLGAFYKYFKFRTHIEFNGKGDAKLSLIKATSGVSGGAIGVSQVKKELTRLVEKLETL